MLKKKQSEGGISELPFASVSKRVWVRNHAYEKEYSFS